MPCNCLRSIDILYILISFKLKLLANQLFPHELFNLELLPNIKEISIIVQFGRWMKLTLTADMSDSVK